MFSILHPGRSHRESRYSSCHTMFSTFSTLAHLNISVVGTVRSGGKGRFDITAKLGLVHTHGVFNKLVAFLIELRRQIIFPLCPGRMLAAYIIIPYTSARRSRMYGGIANSAAGTGFHEHRAHFVSLI